VPDRIVFEHVIAALAHGSGYEWLASPGCSDRTIRRRLQEGARLGLAELVHMLALRAYDRMIGLELEALAVDACITKAPSGGAVAGRSPVDRGKQGLKRSVLTDGAGLPLHLVSAGANRHDAPCCSRPWPGWTNSRGCRRMSPCTWIGPSMAPPAARSWQSWASTAPSLARGCRPRSKPAAAGPWSGRTPG